ncbi:MAG: 50S ribosomal protein L28 [Patescibacteria group bacterium]|nr:50S ribosomal protein L28 [Patescibacteria group bacterium]
MARRCALSGKSKDFGKQRSHSMRQTIKLREVNLQTVRLFDGGNFKKTKIAASTLRTLYKRDHKLEKSLS